MRKKVNIQIQKAQKTPTMITTKRTVQRYVKSNCQKTKKKKKILKIARKKQLDTYKGAFIRLSTDFPAETLQGRREGDYIFQVLRKKRRCQPKTLHPANLFFKK